MQMRYEVDGLYKCELHHVSEVIYVLFMLYYVYPFLQEMMQHMPVAQLQVWQKQTQWTQTANSSTLIFSFPVHQMQQQQMAEENQRSAEFWTRRMQEIQSIDPANPQVCFPQWDRCLFWSILIHLFPLIEEV